MSFQTGFIRDTSANLVTSTASGLSQTTLSTATTGNVTVKTGAGRYYGYITGAVGTNVTAIPISDGSAGNTLDVLAATTPANTQHWFPGGIPFATSLFITGVAGGPTITVYFQ